ncbi:putative membrane protein YkvI [Georgenia soli]|uniref:Putative membrane protein YkvI n=1 Tax=Georgenia soli TaxID=638953 RepID=A0A2A9EMD2_9MICO|nr:hypothetical protein [Georgenia soli]PFG40124.1 putative membrane protein YkvI [Georgenia soli]
MRQGRQAVSWTRVITFGGAIIAFLIGSGFATGQEIMQYFTSYGYWGVFGTGLAVLALMTYVCVEFLYVGQTKQFARPSMIYQYYCGKYLGTFFDYFSIVFIFMSFMVMVSGMGALFEQHYSLPGYVGGAGLAVVAAMTVFFGLGRLVDVIGKVGPVIVAIAIGLGLWAVVRNPGGIAEGNAVLPDLAVTQASSNWFLAALSYVGFCMLWLAAFLTAMGRTARSRKEAVLGGAVGSVAFSAACIVVGLGLLANVAQVHGAEIPMLHLAANVSPLLADGFSLIIVAGIYTTAVPLLWTVASRVFADRSPRFKGLSVGLAALGCVLGLMVPFSTMINVVYVINGYVGVLLLALMLVRTTTRILRRGSAPAPAAPPGPAAPTEATAAVTA